METNIFALITFANSHLVLKAEKTLEQANQEIRVIPLPSEISSGCGLSIMCDINELDKMLIILKTENIAFKHCYKVMKNGLNKQIDEIKF